MVQPGRYAGIYEGEEEGPPPGVFAVRNLFVDNIDRAAAETIIDQVTASTSAMAVTQIRVLGGAIARVPEDGDGLRPPSATDHAQHRVDVRKGR